MKQILTIITLAILFMSMSFVEAQTGIGTQTPNADAAVEISSTGNDKGMLLPRVALTATNAAAPLTAFVEGMTVYNTATVSDVTPGYYYSDGSAWVRLSSDMNLISSDPGNLISSGSDGRPFIDQAIISANETPTSLTLNATTGQLTYDNETATDDVINMAVIEPWFGTDDNMGATLNTEDIYHMGNIGIGTNSPSEVFQVFGGNVEIGGIGTGALQNPLLRIHADANTPDMGGSIEFNESDTNFGYRVKHYTATGGTGGAEGFRFLSLKNVGAYTQVMKLDNTGFVGIGTNTPNEKLEVNGKVRINDLTGADVATDVIVTADAVTGELKEGGTISSLMSGADTNTTNVSLTEDGTNLILTDSDSNTVSGGPFGHRYRYQHDQHQPY